MTRTKIFFKNLIIFGISFFIILISSDLFVVFAQTDVDVKEIATARTEKHVSFFTPPILMIPAPDFNFEKTDFGYADKNKKITIEATQLHLPYKTLLDEFNVNTLKKVGLELKSKTDFLWNKTSATLLKVFQAGEYSVIGKWVLLLDKGEKSWMISSSYDSKNQDHAAALLEMIKSAYWEENEQREQLDEFHTVKIDIDKRDIKFAGISQGASVYTKDGNLPTKSSDGALFVISKSKNIHNITSNRYLPYAKEKIKSIEPDKKLNILTENSVTIDGLQGIEIVADVKKDNSEEDGLLFLTMLFDNKNIHTFVGIAKKDVANNLELFHSLCLSYKQDA